MRYDWHIFYDSIWCVTTNLIFDTNFTYTAAISSSVFRLEKKQVCRKNINSASIITNQANTIYQLSIHFSVCILTFTNSIHTRTVRSQHLLSILLNQSKLVSASDKPERKHILKLALNQNMLKNFYIFLLFNVHVVSRNSLRIVPSFKLD